MQEMSPRNVIGPHLGVHNRNLAGQRKAIGMLDLVVQTRNLVGPRRAVGTMNLMAKILYLVGCKTNQRLLVTGQVVGDGEEGEVAQIEGVLEIEGIEGVLEVEGMEDLEEGVGQAEV